MKANQIVEKARSYIGVTETYNNNVVFNTEYYGHTVNGSQYPWCVVFIWYIFHSLKADSLFYDGKKTAYSPTLMNWFRSKGQFRIMPEVGDVVFYDFSGRKNNPSHVGIVSKVLPGNQIMAIEGNTSSTSQTNGGMVEEKRRDLKYCIGFGRPEYTSNISTVEEKKETKPVKDDSVLFHEKAKNGVKFTITASALKMRADAPDGKVVKVIPKGSTVTWYGYHKIINGTDLWLLVTDGKSTGYMCKNKGTTQFMK